MFNILFFVSIFVSEIISIILFDKMNRRQYSSAYGIPKLLLSSFFFFLISCSDLFLSNIGITNKTLFNVELIIMTLIFIYFGLYFYIHNSTNRFLAIAEDKTFNLKNEFGFREILITIFVSFLQIYVLSLALLFMLYILLTSNNKSIIPVDFLTDIYLNHPILTLCIFFAILTLLIFLFISITLFLYISTKKYNMNNTYLLKKINKVNYLKIFVLLFISSTLFSLVIFFKMSNQLEFTFDIILSIIFLATVFFFFAIIYGILFLLYVNNSLPDIILRNPIIQGIVFSLPLSIPMIILIFIDIPHNKYSTLFLGVTIIFFILTMYYSKVLLSKEIEDILTDSEEPVKDRYYILSGKHLFTIGIMSIILLIIVLVLLPSYKLFYELKILI